MIRRARRTPAGAQIGVLLDLLVVAGIMVALIAFEAVRYASARHRIRHHGGHTPTPEDAAAD